MEISQILVFISGLPGVVWFIAIVALMLILSDRLVWDFEVVFPRKEGIGGGEIELKCFKKRGHVIEAVFELEAMYQNKEIEVFLNNTRILLISAGRNCRNYFSIKEAVDFMEPCEGDEVIVKMDDRLVFKGPLLLD